MLNEMTPAYESEKTLIGGLLLDCPWFTEVRHKLCPNDFFDSNFKRIFESMYRVYEKRGIFDAAMIADDSGMNIHYLAVLSGECCSTNNLKAHAEIIREKSVQRHLAAVVKDMNGQGLEPLDEDEMAADFAAFTYLIQPSLMGDEINLILVCVHNESNINTNALIDPIELLEGGHGYLFGLMNQLTMIMKSKPCRSLADLHQHE